MKDQKTIGFIGAGNMAQAIIKGMIGSAAYAPKNIMLYDIDTQKCKQVAQAQGVAAAADSHEVVLLSDLIFLAVKPQNYEEVLSTLSAVVTKEKIFVSIAAGISTAYVVEKLGVACPVIRVMPNTPLLLGQGATALCRAADVTDEAFALVCDIFAASGEIAVLEESKMNAVIAVNGSSPAYVYLFAKALLDYADSVGISKEAALKLVSKTLEGSAAMLRSSGNSADELIKMVSSPGGTTMKALESLEKDGFYQALFSAMEACTKRAEELGK